MSDNTQTIYPTDSKVNTLIKELFNYWRERERKLVNFLYKEGHKQRKIAEILGTSRSAVALHYPKENQSESEAQTDL